MRDSCWFVNLARQSYMMCYCLLFLFIFNGPIDLETNYLKMNRTDPHQIFRIGRHKGALFFIDDRSDIYFLILQGTLP